MGAEYMCENVLDQGLTNFKEPIPKRLDPYPAEGI